jgi:hypothetical protein
MIQSQQVISDLDDFRMYLRNKLKNAIEEDVFVIEKIYGDFCEGVGKHLE